MADSTDRAVTVVSQREELCLRVLSHQTERHQRILDVQSSKLDASEHAIILDADASDEACKNGQCRHGQQSPFHYQ